MKRILLSILVFALTACGSMTSGSFPEAGATQGGAKDLSLAREKLSRGEMPQVDDFTFEGMYSEHDLPVPGSTCKELLCVRAATAVAPDVSSSASVAWVQLGMSSNIDLSTFQRPALNAAIVLDNSGSMGTDKMEAAKAAAEKLIDLLGPDDLLTVVRFDSFSQVLIGPEPVADKERFKAAVRKIHSGGSTCIECGLKDAFAKLEPVRSAKRSNRVFLMTDAQPNVGATGEGEFTRLLDGAAEKDIFMSVFGVGLDFGQALATRISAVRGANYAFLSTPEQTSKVFDEDFDMLVTPIAFDLALSFKPSSMAVASVYGVPGESAATGGYDLTVKTVFLSKRRGAIVARLTGSIPNDGAVGSVALAFRTAENDVREFSLPVQLPAEGTRYAGPSTRRAVALTRFVAAARDVCRLHSEGDRMGAAARAAEARDELKAEATDSADAELTAELPLAEQLATAAAK